MPLPKYIVMDDTESMHGAFNDAKAAQSEAEDAAKDDAATAGTDGSVGVYQLMWVAKATLTTSLARVQ